jgi:hypothetical protein
MRVMQQVLAPRMQDCNKANVSTKMFGISSNGAQCLGCGLEQDVVDHRLVLKRDGCNFLWDGEDHVEVFDRQKFSLTILKPLVTRKRLALWAMSISAAVVGDTVVATGITLLYVPTQRDGPALLDGAHHARLSPTQTSRVF